MLISIVLNLLFSLRHNNAQPTSSKISNRITVLLYLYVQVKKKPKSCHIWPSLDHCVVCRHVMKLTSTWWEGSRAQWPVIFPCVYHMFRYSWLEMKESGDSSIYIIMYHYASLHTSPPFADYANIDVCNSLRYICTYHWTQNQSLKLIIIMQKVGSAPPCHD